MIPKGDLINAPRRKTPHPDDGIDPARMLQGRPTGAAGRALPQDVAQGLGPPPDDKPQLASTSAASRDDHLTLEGLFEPAPDLVGSHSVCLLG
jgi:hypothetical protein